MKVRYVSALAGTVCAVAIGVAVQGADASASVSLAGIPASSQVAKPTQAGGNYLIPIGNGKTIKWKKGTPLKLAYLTIGSSNDYLTSENAEVAKEVHAVGGSVTTYNANFDAPTQIDQLQTVLGSGKFNAMIVNPVDAQLECKAITQQAPAKNILVGVIVGPACNHAASSEAGTWAPGTLDFVGGDGQPSEIEQYLEAVAKSVHGTQQVAIFVGPQNNPPSINFVNAAKAVFAKYKNLQLVATYYTDYSTSQGYQDAQSLLQAHPNLSMIITSYDEITQGVFSALQQAGKLGKMKVFDKGGGTWDTQQLKKKLLSMDLPQYPISNAKAAVDALELAISGKATPRYLGNDGHTTVDEPLYVTPQNVAKFHPEYQG